MGSPDKISEEGRDKAVPGMTGWIEMATFDAVVFAVANLVLFSVGERMSPFKFPRFKQEFWSPSDNARAKLELRRNGVGRK